MTFTTLKAKDGASDLIFLKAKGIGEETDPFVPVQSVELQNSEGLALGTSSVLEEGGLKYLLSVSVEKADQLAELITLLTSRLPADLNETNLRVVLPADQAPVSTTQGLSVPPHRKIEMDYTPTGDLSEVRYFENSDSPLPLATVSLQYDSNRRITSIIKSDGN
jgi:hypothetical protein